MGRDHQATVPAYFSPVSSESKEGGREGLN